MNLRKLKILKIYSYTILITILISFFILDNIRIFAFSTKSIFIYFVKPIIYIAIIIYIKWMPNVYSECKLRYKKEVYWWVIYSASIYSALTFLGGILDGFGETPYVSNYLGVIFFSTSIISKEMVRAIIVNGIKKYKVVAIIGVTVMMTIFEINLNTIVDLNSKIEILKFLSEIVLVNLSINILMTYLVYIGGARFSATYLLILKSVDMFVPVLPDLSWITKTFITTACVAITIISIQYVNSKISKKIKDNCEEKSPFSLAVTSILGIMVVWFTIGVFPVYPSVIATGSMKPVIHDGDVVIVKKLKEENLKVNDIVKYKGVGDINIVHRIVEIVEKDGVKMYKLKGDNNTRADKELVSIDSIKGKIIKVIPKIGWISLILKGNSIDNQEVEY